MGNIDYDTPLVRLDGTTETLGAYRGRVLLVVNTASKCGFTPQYRELEALWKRYGERGLTILGFPCDQFGHQEPGTEDEIASFCEINFGVTFPMFAKIEVNGPGAHPLFATLKEAAPGLLGTRGIKWNFTKFLVDRQGTIVARYAPRTSPEQLVPDIERLLQMPHP